MTRNPLVTPTRSIADRRAHPPRPSSVLENPGAYTRTFARLGAAVVATLFAIHSVPATAWDGPVVRNLHLQTVRLSRDSANRPGKCVFDDIDASWENRGYRSLRYSFPVEGDRPAAIYAAIGEQLMAGGMSELPPDILREATGLCEDIWRPGADSGEQYSYRFVGANGETELSQVQYSDAVSLSSTFFSPNHLLGYWDTEGKLFQSFASHALEDPNSRIEDVGDLRIVTQSGKYWNVYYFKEGILLGRIGGLRDKVTQAVVVTSHMDVGGHTWPQEAFSLDFKSDKATRALAREDIPRTERGLRGLWKYAAHMPHDVQIHAILAIDDDAVDERIRTEVDVDDKIQVLDGRFGDIMVIYPHKEGRSRRELMAIVREQQEHWPEDRRPVETSSHTAWYVALTIVIVGGIAGLRIIDVRRRKDPARATNGTPKR